MENPTLPTNWLAALSIYSVRPAPATSTSTVPQPANAMSCCCSVDPALLSILTYRTSPRSSASPRRCSPKFAKASLSEHKNSFLQKFTETSFRVSPLAAFFRSCRGLFRGTFCNFVARNNSRRRLQYDVNAPNEIFPRKRSI